MPISLHNYCFYLDDMQQVMSSKGCSKHGKMKIGLKKISFSSVFEFFYAQDCHAMERALLCCEKSHKKNFVLYQYLKYANMISSQRPKIMLGMNS